MIWFINLIRGKYTLSKLHFHFWTSPCTFGEPHLENSRSEFGKIMILCFSMTLTDLLYWSGPIWFMLQYPINNCQHTSHDIIQVSISRSLIMLFQSECHDVVFLLRLLMSVNMAAWGFVVLNSTFLVNRLVIKIYQTGRYSYTVCTCIWEFLWNSLKLISSG